MLGLCKYAELPKLVVEVFHELRNPRLDDSEVVVVHFLTLRRLCAEQPDGRDALQSPRQPNSPYWLRKPWQRQQQPELADGGASIALTG